MTSSDRREARYLRRKKKRKDKIIKRAEYYSDINRMFTFSKVMKYADKVCLGVGYKRSTQYFKLHKFTNISCCCHDIKSGIYKVNNPFHFTLNERGKIREIDAPHIKDRLVHKVLSNELLVSLYSPHMIYDNGACIKNKGFSFCLRRVKYKLREYISRYGIDGYIVLIDYSKYFENINHDKLHLLHEKYIIDEKCIKILEDYLYVGKGLALGVEMAQREACLFPSILDHYLEDNGCMVERYMDDTFFICRSYEDADLILRNYYELANRLDIKINKSKTRIYKMGESFLFCKWKFIWNRHNKYIMIPCRSTLYRQRRKIRSMIKKGISKIDIDITKTCFSGYLSMGNHYYDKKYLRELKS